MDSQDAGTTGSAPRDAAGPPTPPPPPPPPPQRRRPNRRRTRLQRVAILAAVIFVLVFVVAWGARSCQQNRKVESYRTYLEAVKTAIDDSAAVGRQLTKAVKSPTKYSRKEFVAKLEEWTAKQDEIAARAQGLQPPDTLATQQAVFAEGMSVRAEGYILLQAALLASLDAETVKPSKIVALAGYFSGPDAYYMSRFYGQTRTVMSDQGVSDVPVPTTTYYLAANTFDRTTVEKMLTSIGKSAKLVGRHGVALLSVTAQPADAALKSGGKTTEIRATADLGFEVAVQNQGDGLEEDIAVKAEIVVPGGQTLTKTSTISSIAAGKTGSVILKDFPLTDALSRVLTLKIEVGPVPDESVKTNNTGSYKILLKLQ